MHRFTHSILFGALLLGFNPVSRSDLAFADDTAALKTEAIQKLASKTGPALLSLISDEKRRETCSGFIVSKSGYFLTSAGCFYNQYVCKSQENGTELCELPKDSPLPSRLLAFPAKGLKSILPEQRTTTEFESLQHREQYPSFTADMIFSGRHFVVPKASNPNYSELTRKQIEAEQLFAVGKMTGSNSDRIKNYEFHCLPVEKDQSLKNVFILTHGWTDSYSSSYWRRAYGKNNFFSSTPLGRILRSGSADQEAGGITSLPPIAQHFSDPNDHDRFSVNLTFGTLLSFADVMMLSIFTPTGIKPIQIGMRMGNFFTDAKLLARELGAPLISENGRAIGLVSHSYGSDSDHYLSAGDKISTIYKAVRDELGQAMADEIFNCPTE